MDGLINGLIDRWRWLGKGIESQKKIRAPAKKTTNPSIPLNDLESDKDGIEKYLLFIINFR